ncbi:hypothetical protein LAUMK4_01536 [Mycobacterium persicum]|uniref:Uncharacterized protein n=1 Tax=Mycobacterium persicum TaxID=1487726 RepID=A0AB38UQF3_9MYCO|nr:hypothetical protein LAUMK15_01900 [Mycobacterium persicum]VAZ82942.1 hypothetical protein LAUMK42_01754 [Mycobacterium persicum]VAZ90769.1 hypothetical protein LAUMK4_01536 [Mycobacterium persicum]
MGPSSGTGAGLRAHARLTRGGSPVSAGSYLKASAAAQFIEAQSIAPIGTGRNAAARAAPGQPRLTLPALMQDVQALMRFLLPPGRLTARTV